MLRALLLLTLLLAQPEDMLRVKWQKIAGAAQGKVGAAAMLLETREISEMLGDTRFPMQSVYKFPIAMAVLRAVDTGALSLDEKILILKTDFVPAGLRSPIRDRHPQGNVSLTLREILRLAVSESDGTASDVLLRLAGGPQRVTDYLRDLGVKEMIVATSEKEMAQAQEVQYRNSATPRAAVELLSLFYSGQDLSEASRALLLQWMTETQTGAHRLKGMLPPATVVAHKTGTSGTVKEGTPATNDIGLITLPGGRHLAIAVFVSDARAGESARESVIAQIARSAWDYWVR
jgi:beta-lactamase class A